MYLYVKEKKEKSKEFKYFMFPKMKSHIRSRYSNNNNQRNTVASKH